MIVRISKVDKKIDNPLPFYATVHSSGLDISSSSIEDIILEPMETKLIPTNLIFEIPTGYEGQIGPRSGLAINYSIGIMNSPGTIDSDYRGELKILLTNFGKQPFIVKFSDRIAQLIISKVERAEIILSEELTETKRNTGGFGHTGIKNERQ